MSSDRAARKNRITLDYEQRLWAAGKNHVAGVDEAGRGPLAGPVVAAAVIFRHDAFIPGVNDSKLLPPSTREQLYALIVRDALAVGVGVVDHAIIDEINILNATYEAMHIAVENLGITPDHLLIDGSRFVGGSIPFSTVIDGDALCFSVAAAAIVAKVTRDRLMMEYDAAYPGYGFARHKGYPTLEHRKAIMRLGYCDIHRRTFEVKVPLERDGKELSVR